ncbi:ring canal kelch protein-like isoform X1 [Hermetia illucens]|nr:ring canal kelch protein-like isoform X1 [Hermetia illucens]
MESDNNYSLGDSTFYILSRCTRNYVYEFNTDTKDFAELPSRPPLSRCAITKYKNFLHVITGERDEKVVNVGLVYDINKKSWTEYHCPVGKAQSEVCTVGDRMYLFGGMKDDGYVQKSCSLYDYATDRWTDLPDMEESRGHPAVAYYNSSIYVMGGFSIARNCKVERFDPREGEWSVAGRVNIFGVLSSAVVGDTIHIMNSYTGKYCQYDPRTLECTPFSESRFEGKQWLGSMHNKLHVIHYGGIDVYDEPTNYWTNILSRRFVKCPFIIC